MADPVSNNFATHCPYEGCHRKLSLTDIKCKQCMQTHCMRHFRPEQHCCAKLEEFKARCHEENKKTLLDQAVKEEKVKKI